MNDFKDKQVTYARLYLFSVPLIVMIGYIAELLSVTYLPKSNISVMEYTGITNNIIGSLLLGYALTGLLTIIYYFIDHFSNQTTTVKVLMCILVIPMSIILYFPAALATIPFYIYTAKKTKTITIDDKNLFSKSRIIILCVFLAASIAVTIVSILHK